jgi:hypothetical protein
MHNRSTAGRRAARLAPFAAAVLAAAASGSSARAQTTAPPIAVDAAHDSVVVSGLGAGRATLQVTRPDADTGRPVVIGQYSASSSPGVPFSVNTSAPSSLKPAGDCWQAGGLSLPGGGGLVPDLLPGDSVGVGGQSVVVPTEGFDAGAATGGPVSGCDAVSTWARNRVSGASFIGSDLAVAGEAQPLATGVAVTASDGTHATAPVDATPAGGRWTATIPAARLAGLADGAVRVDGVYAVADVASGAAARIHGRPLSVEKRTPAAIALTGLRAPSAIALRSVLEGKLTASFIVPTGARYVRARLARPGHTALLVIGPAAAPGSRQTVRLASPHLRKRLVRGRYTITVSAGPTKMRLGSPALRTTVLLR